MEEASHPGSIDAQWARIRGRLRAEVGEAAFKSWLNPLIFDGVSDGAVKMALPTRFMRDHVMKHYAERLKLLWSGENPGVRAVEIVVAPGGAPVERPSPHVQASSAGSSHTGSSHTGASHMGASRNGSAHNGSSGVNALAVKALAARARPAPRRGDAEHGGAGAPITAEPEGMLNGAAIQAPLDPRLTFQNFVVGKPNELAFAAARRVADASAVPFNPLFLYGGVGLGKTHLMHAIAWEIRNRDPQRRVIYLSAEKFMYQFIRALRFRDTVAFKEQFRSVDVLMIDDVQFISGKDSTQEEFFHTFNALVDQNRQVVISADKSPSDLEGLEERLRSRLGWGLVADIHPTTYELRLGILQSKAEQLRAQIPQKVTEFLAHKIQSNVRELEGALNRIVAHSTLVGRDITLESTQEVLHDLLRANDRRCHHRGDPEARRRALHHPDRRHELGAACPRGRPAAPGRDVSRQAADLALAARDRP